MARTAGKCNSVLTWHLLSAAGPVVCSGEGKRPEYLVGLTDPTDPQMAPSFCLLGELPAAAPRGKLRASLTRSAKARAQGLGSFLSLTSVQDVVEVVKGKPNLLTSSNLLTYYVI